MRQAQQTRLAGTSCPDRDPDHPWACATLRARTLLVTSVLAAVLVGNPRTGNAAFDYATGADATPGGSAAAPALNDPGAGAAADAPAILPAHDCDVASEVAPEPDLLPSLASAVKEGERPLTIVVLGSLSGDAGPAVKGVPGFPLRLQAHLEKELAARSLEPSVRVESVGRVRALAGDLAALIRREVLPLKPALVIWQVGRADARQANPPNRFSQSLKDGLDILQEKGIPAILADIQFHPQFEALYRTDDYRNYVRWVAGKRDVPLLNRFEMIEQGASSGSVDLDSGDDADQQAAYRFIQECLAYQATRMILGAAGIGTR
jgi:hypothetical protein